MLLKQKLEQLYKYLLNACTSQVYSVGIGSNKYFLYKQQVQGQKYAFCLWLKGSNVSKFYIAIFHRSRSTVLMPSVAMALL